MIRAAYLIIGLSSCAVAAETWQLSDAAQGYTYTTETTGSWTIDGVCEVRPSSVTCWTPDGRYDSALGAAVDAQLQGLAQQHMSLRFHARNLLVASSLSGGPGMEPEVIQSINGFDRTATLENVSTRDGRRHGLHLLEAPTEDASADLVAQFPIPVEPVRLPLKRGARAIVGPGTVTFGEIRRSPALGWPMYGPPQSPRWTLDVALSGFPTQAKVRLNPSLLGRDGKPLRQSTAVTRAGGAAKAVQVATAVFESGPVRDGTAQWVIDSDPSQIGAIALKPNYYRRVTFRNVALAPRP